MTPLRILFVCSRNQWRSPTAEAIYRNDPRIEARSAGTSSAARYRVTASLLRWADLVLVMEHEHKQRLRDQFPKEFRDVEVAVLNIPDDYQPMDPELIELLLERVEPWIDRGQDTPV